MARIYIVPRKTYEIGMHYEDYSTELHEINKELEDIHSAIDLGWKDGVASYNFLESFKEHASKILPIADFLDFEAGLIKTTAVNHNQTDYNLKVAIERSEDEEWIS